MASAPATERAAAARIARIEQTLPLYRGVMERALDGSAAPRGAIKAFCLHCVGDKRADVTSCTAYACPLYRYRPYQTDDEPEETPDGQ
jgi:hypothetical protein